MAIRTCGYCGLKRAQMVEVVIDRQFFTISAGHIFQSVLQCPDCGRMTIVEHTDPGHMPHEIRAYPESDDLRHQIDYLPEDVDQYYSDARRVLDAGVPDAAAVQLRRTLEAAAAHFDVRERNLVASIRKLIEEGLVTRQFGEALEHIREVGNLGAHATDQRVDEVAAQRVMNFTTLLLRNLFEVPGELASASSDPGEADESDSGV
jgi:hypothetical protein